MSRREFTKAVGALAVGAWAAPVVGAEERKYRTVLIGSGWWGLNILREAVAAGASEVVALCDVDQRQLGAALPQVEEWAGGGRQPTKTTGSC